MKYTSPVYSAASGSIAGITYSHNRGGMYTRARAVPTNPNSTLQQAARTALGTANSQWAALSSSNQALWDAYAEGTSWTDSLGNPITVTGQQAYIRWATVALRGGQSINIAPTAGTYGFGEPPDGITAEAATPEVIVGCTYGFSADGQAYVQMSLPMAAGQASVRRPIFLDGYGATTSAGTSSNFTPNAALVSGERRTMRAVVAYEDGRLSQPYTDVITIAAA